MLSSVELWNIQPVTRPMIMHTILLASVHAGDFKSWVFTTYHEKLLNNYFIPCPKLHVPMYMLQFKWQRKLVEDFGNVRKVSNVL